MEGNGGNAGGPSTAAIDATGNGTVDKPGEGKEQAACGAPGQPKCGIDETGTPDGKGRMASDLSSFGNELKKREDALGTVTSASGKDTSWGIMPQWTQGGTCSPWHIFTLPPFLNSMSVDLNLCPYKVYTDGIANFIWVALAIFAITSMVFAAMTSKGT